MKNDVFISVGDLLVSRHLNYWFLITSFEGHPCPGAHIMAEWLSPDGLCSGTMYSTVSEWEACSDWQVFRDGGRL